LMDADASIDYQLAAELRDYIAQFHLFALAQHYTPAPRRLTSGHLKNKVKPPMNADERG
jgi:hypothetical protein